MTFFDYAQMLHDYKSITREDYTLPELSAFVDFLMEVAPKHICKSQRGKFESLLLECREQMHDYEDYTSSLTLEQLSDPDFFPLDFALNHVKWAVREVAEFIMLDAFTGGYFDFSE